MIWCIASICVIRRCCQAQYEPLRCRKEVKLHHSDLYFPFVLQRNVTSGTVQSVGGVSGVAIIECNVTGTQQDSAPVIIVMLIKTLNINISSHSGKSGPKYNSRDSSKKTYLQV